MKRLFALSAVAGVLVLVSPATGAPNPVVESATGSGHRISAGEFRSFSFSAVLRADGTATGQAEVHARSLDALAHIAIDCLAVDGNIAHMSGTVTHTSDPTIFLPDEQVHFAVQDNGEGADDPADRITGIPENDPSTCNDALPATAPFNDIVRGNVQVR